MLDERLFQVSKDLAYTDNSDYSWERYFEPFNVLPYRGSY